MSEPPKPRALTLDELRALAREYREKADDIESAIAKLESATRPPGPVVFPEDSVPTPAEPAILAPLNRGLSRSNEYVTIPAMPSTSIVAPVRKRRGPPSEGIVNDIATELGFASMKDLADAIQESENNARSWNHRGSIPERAAKKIEKLRKAKAERAAKIKRS